MFIPGAWDGVHAKRATWSVRGGSSENNRVTDSERRINANWEAETKQR